jgi:hypothetical protein
MLDFPHDGIVQRRVKMRSRAIALLILSCLPLLMAGTALAGEGVDVKITNDGTQDIVVTIYDTSTSPRRVVITNARINGFTSLPVSLNADATGKANLSWTAISTDREFRKCGHDDAVVANSASVSVHAESSCDSLAATASTSEQ